MTLAGRLEATADGRPVTIEAAGTVITVRPSGLAHAWALRRQWPTWEPLLDQITLVTGAQIVADVPGLPRLDLHPNRSLMARALLPSRS